MTERFMEKERKMVILPCDCRCCMFVVEKTIWQDGEVDYDISIQDSRYDHNYNTCWGRVKRAIMVLFGKPVYFNDVYIESEEKYKQLLSDMQGLLEETGMNEVRLHDKNGI